jgi:LacI family transcriptional regulator
MGSTKKAATIKDIAELAKVSIGTVDRAIHNRGRVARNVVVRINKIIREIGYKPNIFASRLSRSKTFHFAVVMPGENQDNKYWEGSIEGIKKAESELSHYHIKVRYFFYDRHSASQISAVYEEILHANIDGILVAPVLEKPIRDFIAKLRPGIPYVLFNTNVPDLVPLTFIGQDSFQSGFVCGKLMKMLAYGTGTLAVILTHPNDLHIRTRADGFKSFFEKETAFSIKEYEIFNFKNAKLSGSRIARIFSENDDLRGIFVTNVSTHYIAEYMEKNLKGKKVYLIGYDLIDKNLKYLDSGLIDFLISQKPEKQGYEGIYALYRKAVLHETCEEKIMMPIDIITKENIGYYMG